MLWKNYEKWSFVQEFDVDADFEVNFNIFEKYKIFKNLGP